MLSGATRGVKITLAALATLSVGLLVAVIVLGALLGNNDSGSGNNPQPPAKSICTTKSCVNAANLIINNIDTSVKPCDNFFKFSCGNFIKTRRIPSDSSSTDAFTDLRNNLANALSDALANKTGDDTEATKKAKIYYATCLDEVEIEKSGEKQLLEQLVELGDSGLINETFIATPESVFERLVKLAHLNRFPLFSITSLQNPKKPTESILRLQQPSWFLLKERYDDAKISAAYQTLISDVIEYFYTFQGVQFNKEDVNAAAKATFEIEQLFAKLQLTPNESRNQKYLNMTIAEFSAKVPGFDFTKFIVDGIFSKYPEAKITADDYITVDDINYFGNFSQIYATMMGDDQQRTLLDGLLVWSFVKPFLPNMPEAYQSANLKFDKLITGAVSLPPRIRTCSNAINNIMPYAVGRLYVQNNFDSNSKLEAEDMIRFIQQEFDVILSKVDWMDAKSRKAAEEKAKAMDVKIGYADYLYNKTKLDSLYEKLNYQDKNLIKNLIESSRFQALQKFGGYRDPIDRKDWISGPAVVNAFYSPENNQITFPAGILQPPFYDSKGPKYLNYGGIGAVIGHEITHGFDDQGRSYDKDGVFYDDGEDGLWTNATILNYKQKAKCIIDQYSNYVMEQVNMNLIGNQTQGENIADNGGIKESFWAYKKWVEKNGVESRLPGLEEYSPEQLFFINFAQIWCQKITDGALIDRIQKGVHSPGQYRVIGSTSNFDEFAKAFECPSGTGNNPVNKCTVW